MAEAGLYLHIILTKLLRTLVEIFKPRIFWFGNDEERSTDDDSKHEKWHGWCTDDGKNNQDPFVILGLQQGSNTTIEEAIQAKRKLARRWHPDRNIGNEEEATAKMQEINHAFERVEQIILTGRDNEEDATQESYDESESDDEDTSWEQVKKEQKDFENKMRAEFEKFNKAQRDASRGRFGSNYSPAAAAASTSNTRKKKLSKSAKKRMRKRKAKDHNTQPSPENVNDTNATGVPFHRMTIEKRCEIKFESNDLLREPLFTGKLR